MEDYEPLSSSEAPLAPALDSVQGLSIPVAGPEAPFRPTSGMPAVGAAACAGPVGWLRVACIGVCAVSARRARPRRGLHCRVSVGRIGSGWSPGRRKRGGWAYACRARVVGIGVRTAAARAECGMWAAWARVEGATLQGFEDRGTTLSLSLSLSLPLTTWHPSLMPLDRTQNAASARGC